MFSESYVTSSSYVNGYDQPDNLNERHTRTTTTTTTSRTAPPRRHRNESRSSEYDIARLLANAPPNSIKQTINVEREEEEIIGPLPADGAENPEGMLNFDTVSEKVDLGVEDGYAKLTVKVRCERIVPIRGVEDMFKKSSVIVTRLIQIDLQATEERRRLHDRIMRGGQKGMSSGEGGRMPKLSTKETFKLYKTFMGLAEADEGMKKEKVHIDKRVEDQGVADVISDNGPPMNHHGPPVDYHGPPVDHRDDLDHPSFDTEALDRELDEILSRKSNKPPEADTISYMSALSEASDLLY